MLFKQLIDGIIFDLLENMQAWRILEEKESNGGFVTSNKIISSEVVVLRYNLVCS